ncbi:Hypothetical predicted protein [Cloeon dipterum]|uniref:Uncharacterized protein n=1 Tax=Cloeon dipterum TaxID=197152 RepID=A0A8S1DQI2_9INSE|nr:Hypothetical predicted protein [Cloeon dipterum]
MNKMSFFVSIAQSVCLQLSAVTVLWVLYLLSFDHGLKRTLRGLSATWLSRKVNVTQLEQELHFGCDIPEAQRGGRGEGWGSSNQPKSSTVLKSEVDRQ